MDPTSHELSKQSERNADMLAAIEDPVPPLVVHLDSDQWIHVKQE